MLTEREREFFRFGYVALTDCTQIANQFRRLAVFVADLATSEDGVESGAYPDIDKISVALADDANFTDDDGERWWVALNSLFLEFATSYVNAHERLEPHAGILRDVCKQLNPQDDDFTASSYAHDALELLGDFFGQSLQIAAGQNAVATVELFPGRHFEVIAMDESNYEMVCGLICSYTPAIDWQPILDRIAWQFQEVEGFFDWLEKESDRERPTSNAKRPAFERDHYWRILKNEKSMTPAKIRDHWNELTEDERKKIDPVSWEKIPTGSKDKGRSIVRNGIRKADEEAKKT